MYVFSCQAVFMQPLHVAPLVLLRVPCAHTLLNHVVVHLLSSTATCVNTYWGNTIGNTAIDLPYADEPDYKK